MKSDCMITNEWAYPVLDNLFGVVILCSSIELTKVIDQWCHARREVQYSIYQLTKWDFAYMGITNY